MTVIVIVIVVLAAVLCAFGAKASGSETVFPKVALNGVPVGGMTQEQAADAIAAADVLPDPNESVKIEFFGGEMLEISLAEAGIAVTPESAAEQAFLYGREGGFFGNALSYIKCLISGAELGTANVSSVIDGDALHARIAEAVSWANSRTVGSAYRISGDRLIITKGLSGMMASEDEVYGLVYDALCSGNYETVKYTPEVKSAEIDLDAISAAVSAEPASATYDKATDTVTESVLGISFDTEEARRLYDAAEPGEDIAVPLTVTEPEVTTEALKSKLFADVLAEKTTSMASSSSSRITNITLAAAAINGTVLMPDEEFSYNGTVGQRTAEKGYKPAGAYVGGQTVDEIGGGICQVSSTIYYCTLLSDLKITSRSNHMYAVSYLPLGMDATVNWGTIDFKFKNNREYPIKIVSYVEGKQLYVQILGTKTDDTEIKLTYEVVSTTGFDTVNEVDETLAPGESKVKTTGYTGYVVNTYKNYYNADGERTDSVLIAKNTYRKRDKVVLVGPEAAPTETPTETPEASETPAPSDTPVPSETPSVPAVVETPTPTETPAPTPTETPTPTPTETPIPETAPPETVESDI